MTKYSLDEGRRLVSAARSSIELFLKDPRFEPEMIKSTLKEFSKPDGVFVTLRHYPNEVVRGHAGFSEPVAPLGESLVEAAIAAAFGDQRFVPVSHRELDDLVIELDIISKMQKVNGEANRIRRLSLGRDGIIIRHGTNKGIIMPEFPVRHKLSKQQVLEEACIHAKLPESYWKQPSVEVFYFTSQRFVEETPSGRVNEMVMNKLPARRRGAANS